MLKRLPMLRFVCNAAFLLMACFMTPEAVLAQNQSGTCEVLLHPDGSKSDRTFLGLKDCYNCHTNGFPKDGFGDRFGIMANDSWILANEVKTWGETDKHAQAYTSLLSDTGKEIGKALGIGENVHRDKRCLACHTGFSIAEMETDGGKIHGLISEDKYKTDIRLTTGVSCEGCHGKAGGSEGWLAAHTSKETWRFLEPEKKCEKGFYDVRSVISRTRLCLSCHLGNASQGRVLTHEMYAAGHPPLSGFEIETFQNQMPKHWRHLKEKADLHKEYQEKTGIKSNADELEHTKSLLVGALIARSESLRLTADIAEGAVSEQISSPQWPDFAQFDCYACHHDLRSESWRQAAQHSGGPGRPTLLPWPSVLSEMVSIPVTDAPATKLDASAIQAAILKAPFGDREALVRSARATANDCDKLALALSSQEVTVRGGTDFLEKIVDVAATETLDYDSARQLVWAFIVVQEELRTHLTKDSASPFLADDLASVKEMFVLNLKNGRLEDHKIPGATQSRPVTAVDLQIVLPPIANYDAIGFQKAFAELRQRNQRR
jgi:hypothetical protein